MCFLLPLLACTWMCAEFSIITRTMAVQLLFCVFNVLLVSTHEQYSHILLVSDCVADQNSNTLLVRTHTQFLHILLVSTHTPYTQC